MYRQCHHGINICYVTHLLKDTDSKADRKNTSSYTFQPAQYFTFSICLPSLFSIILLPTFSHIRPRFHVRNRQRGSVNPNFYKGTSSMSGLLNWGFPLKLKKITINLNLLWVIICNQISYICFIFVIISILRQTLKEFIIV